MARTSAGKSKAKAAVTENAAGGGSEQSYGPQYFSHYFDAQSKSGERPYERSDHWMRFFGSVADHIVSDIDPQTVFDAGCAMGFLVEALRDRGVDASGIDISEYAISQVRPDIKPYCRQGSVTDPLSSRYDLIVSIEVLEHLATEDAIRAVNNLCSATTDFIFSSTPQDYREITHVNVQPPEWWGEVFAKQGFFRDVEYDPSTYISPWAVRYRRTRDTVPRTVGGYERLIARLKSENQTLRQLAAEQRGQLDRVEDLERVSGPRLLARTLLPAESSRGKLVRRLVKRPR
ncbi:MAG TPA: class I SAM-dependent methyltransferase [Candidatus Acidoferrum sp.]|nr:class I SAM-dependent methyltransferase [Candidatus Acidoferrum sp.]